MFELADRPLRAARFPLDRWFERARRRLARLTRAWSYSTGRLLATDAQQIIRDCRYPAGWHPLLVLTVEDTLARARERLADHPDLPWLIAEGCIHVERRWATHDDDLEQARQWAIDLAQRYAAEDGIVLCRTDGRGSAS
jgi:hypothetical protein